MLKKKFIAVFVLLLLSEVGLFMASPLPKGKGTIKGYVYDTQGNTVLGVLITAKNVDSGFEFKMLSDQHGYFHFSDLPFGAYEISAEIAGFVRAVQYSDVSSKEDSVTLVFKLKMVSSLEELEELMADKAVVGGIVSRAQKRTGFEMGPSEAPFSYPHHPGFNTEEYDRIYENIFLSALSNSLSTFSIDVDTASYANVRRFITNNQAPYKDAVRIEEMINYFSYDYPLPSGKRPFSVYTEISSCPWNQEHMLLHIGLQGRRLEIRELPPSNL